MATLLQRCPLKAIRVPIKEGALLQNRDTIIFEILGKLSDDPKGRPAQQQPLLRTADCWFGTILRHKYGYLCIELLFLYFFYFLRPIFYIIILSAL